MRAYYGCYRCGSQTNPRYPGQSYCMQCAVDYKNEVNERTKDTATEHRQPWSRLEDDTLLEAKAAGMSIEDMAVLVGRTYHAVHARVHILRYKNVSYDTIRTVTTTTTTTVKVERVCPDCHITLPCYC